MRHGYLSCRARGRVPQVPDFFGVSGKDDDRRLRAARAARCGRCQAGGQYGEGQAGSESVEGQARSQRSEGEIARQQCRSRRGKEAQLAAAPALGPSAKIVD